jgi:Domain of unknown function (DUF4259)
MHEDTMPSATFEHDDVADWLVAFETDGVSAIEAALTLITELEKTDYLEITDAACALAAAELVAAARDEDLSRLPKGIHSALEGHEDAINAAKLTSPARKAVQRILKSSELQEQMEESSDGDEWADDVGELLERLRG